MTVLASPETPLMDPVSPELVLVSPPEVGRIARSLLSFPVTKPAAVLVSERIDQRLRPAELAAVWLLCLVMTLGPLVFILAAHP